MSDMNQALLARARALLAAYGWKVALDDAVGPPALRLDHPLTSSRVVVLSQDADDGWLARVLRHREFGVIERAPPVSSNAALIRGLRVLAAGQVLEATALSAVAALLRSCALLSEDEARWLHDAGAAWLERREEPGDPSGP